MKTSYLPHLLAKSTRNRTSLSVKQLLLLLIGFCVSTITVAQQSEYHKLIVRANSHYKKEDYASALPLLIEAGKVMPADTVAPSIAGFCATKTGNYEVAKQQYELYMNRGGRNIVYYRGIVAEGVLRQDYKQALIFADKGLSIQSDEYLWTIRADALLIYNEIKDAIKAANKVKELIKVESKNMAKLQHLGYLYTEFYRRTTDNDLLRAELLLQAKTFLSHSLSFDQKNFDGNSRMGFTLYCEAYNIKKEADAANSRERADIESRAYCAFKQALIYYERASQIKNSDDDVNKNISRIQYIIKGYESRQVSCTTTPGQKPVQDTRPSTVAQNTEVNKPVRPSAVVPVPKPTNTKPIQSNVAAFSRRYALVVGNSTYQNGSSLEGLPVNDATDMATRLRSLGFTVTLLTNTGKIALETGIGQFNQQLKNADVALFFYAGHGIESDNHNYLIPVDAKLTEPDDADLQGVDVQKLIDRMRRNSQTAFNIIILDACRDNPFKAFNRGGSRGFKQVSDLSSESNMYLAMATGWGNVADNGSGRNGIYTSALLNNLRAGEFLDDVLLRTQIEVKKQTKNRQNPQLVTEMAQEVKLKF